LHHGVEELGVVGETNAGVTVLRVEDVDDGDALGRSVDGADGHCNQTEKFLIMDGR